MTREEQAQTRTNEALNILGQLGFTKRQQNPRSAWTLLALLGLKPDDPWGAAGNPLVRTTQVMEFIKEHYYHAGYAPNTRESVRKHTIHHFLRASLIVKNPDKPDRPTNSGKTVYRISDRALELLRGYDTDGWDELLADYKAELPAIQKTYEGQRRTGMIPLRLPSGKEIRLSPGGQNTLVEMICTEFVHRFVPDATIPYVGDTAKKFRHRDEQELEKLGVHLDPYGKIPDVILYDPRRNWLFLVEAVSSQGPIDTKRREELQEMCSNSKAGLVYVTAFIDRETMKRFIVEISWKTEVWVAESPDHLIHFDGERFLGPYMQT